MMWRASDPRERQFRELAGILGTSPPPALPARA
jgi:hypothetical protein